MREQEISKNLLIKIPPRRRNRFIVHIPASVISVEKGVFKKTFVAGLIARACGIFRVDIIDIYKDPDAESEDVIFLKKILDYIRTPHYLRKILIPLDKDLRGVGVLPPLTTPNQGSFEETSKDYEIREAVIIKKSRDKICMEAGLSDKICVKRDKLRKKLDVGEIVYIKIRGEEFIDFIDEDFLKRYYWVFDVSTSDSLRDSLRKYDSYLLISTRKGVYLDEEISRKILEIFDKKDLSIVFGSPEKDPDEIAEIEKWDLNKLIHISINTAPLQGVRSIRTYEALYITLALLNNIIFLSKSF